MKITKTQLTDLIRDELENFKIVKLTADDMEQLHKSGQIEKDGVFYQYQEPVDEGKKIIVKSIPGRKIQLDLENEAQAFIDGLKKDNKKISLKNISDYIDAEYKFFNSPKLNHQVFNYIKKNLKKLSETKLKEGFDLKKLEDAIKMFQKKIKKQGRVTNARDEEHLKQLIKVYKDMGGRKIKEGKLTEDVYAIVDKFNQKKQDYDQVYFKDKNLNKVKKHLKKMGSKYGKMNLIKVKTNGKMSVVEGKLTEKKMDRRKAAEILKQIGGNRFIAMTGAKGFAFSDKYMSFKIGRNSKGINFVRIGHNAKDLYDMQFGFVSTKGIKVKKKVKDVYADMLGTIFTKYTGMHVRL